LIVVVVDTAAAVVNILSSAYEMRSGWRGIVVMHCVGSLLDAGLVSIWMGDCLRTISVFNHTARSTQSPRLL